MYDSTKFYTNKIFYQQNRTLLTYLYIFDDGFDKKVWNFRAYIQNNQNIWNNIFKYYENDFALCSMVVGGELIKPKI